MIIHIHAEDTEDPICAYTGETVPLDGQTLTVDVANDDIPPVITTTDYNVEEVKFRLTQVLGRKPFRILRVGHQGATGYERADTHASRMAAALNSRLCSDHRVLHDTQFQAEIFRLIQRKIREE